MIDNNDYNNVYFGEYLEKAPLPFGGYEEALNMVADKYGKNRVEIKTNKMRFFYIANIHLYGIAKRQTLDLKKYSNLISLFKVRFTTFVG